MHSFSHLSKYFTGRALRSAGLNLLLLLLGTLFALAIVEIALDLFIPPLPDVRMSDPYIGKKFIPNLEVLPEDNQWHAHIRTNSLGWNTKEFAVEKTPNTTRIVHLGDSITEGLHVDTDKTFSWLIGTQLPDTESLDLGMAGNGTYPELLTYHYYAKSYSPDVVFLWFSDNDFRDNYLVRNIVDSSPTTPIPQNDLGWLKTLLLTRLRLPRILYNLTYQNHIVVSLLIKTGLLSMEPQEFSDPVPLIYRTTVLDTPERAESLAVTRKLITALAKEVAPKKLVIGYVGSYLETHANSQEELRSLFPAIGTQTIENGFPQRSLTILAKELHVEFFDLTSTFKQAYKDGNVPHIPNDGHLNATGHELVAKTTATWLQEKKLCCGFEAK